MPSLTIVLQPNEYDALLAMAQRERRKTKHQASVILRDRLRRAGLLQNETAPTVETLAGDTVGAAHSEPSGSESAPLEGAQHE